VIGILYIFAQKRIKKSLVPDTRPEKVKQTIYTVLT